MNLKKYNDTLSKTVKEFEKKYGYIEEFIYHEFTPLIHSMKQEEIFKYDEFNDPDLSSLENYERILNGNISN